MNIKTSMLLSILTLSSAVNAGEVRYTNLEGKQVSYDSTVDTEVFHITPNVYWAWRLYTWKPVDHPFVTEADMQVNKECRNCFMEVTLKVGEDRYQFLVNISDADLSHPLHLSGFILFIEYIDIYTSDQVLPVPKHTILVADIQKH